MLDADRHLREFGPRGWTLFAALAFGLGGLITVVIVFILYFSSIEGFTSALSVAVIISPAPGIAGLAVGGLLWYLVVEVRAIFTERTGAVVGALTGLLSHFFLWLLVLLARVPGEQSIALLEELRRVIVSGFISLAFAGIITVPVGAFIGWQFMRLRRSVVGEELSGSGDRVGSE